MLKFLIILFQFIIIFVIASLAIQHSKPVSFEFNDVIITTSTSVFIIGLLIIIVIALLLQRFMFFLKQSSQKYKFYREKTTYQRGHNSFVQGMVALANKDYKRAMLESKNINKYLKEDTLGLLLRSETLKIEKKYNELNEIYEKMIQNPNTNILGLRGLMEQNLLAQDYHHAYIYGEKLFNLNPHIDKLYATLVNIIGKTNNWQKLLYITDLSFRKKIINKKVNDINKSIAFYEIAKIKHLDSEKEAIDLMEKSIKLYPYFPPFISFYIRLLIGIRNLQKAKKILSKTWTFFPHPDLKKEIKLLAKAMKISLYDLVKYITSNSSTNMESIILMTETLIEEEKWEEAKNQIKVFLEHKPTKEICLLMARIEEGDNGDPQKINSWVSRSNFGKLSKVWVCQISGLTQNNWSPVSEAGHFNTLVWEFPKNVSTIDNTIFELDTNKYIEN